MPENESVCRNCSEPIYWNPLVGWSLMVIGAYRGENCWADEEAPYAHEPIPDSELVLVP